MEGIKEIHQFNAVMSNAEVWAWEGISEFDFVGVDGRVVEGVRILGDILEYHLLRQHGTFGSNRAFLQDIRSNIEQNLRLWGITLQSNLESNLESHLNCSPDAGRVAALLPTHNILESEKIVLYGKHIWHCLHILLFGTMDFIGMYKDLAWQSSSDFVQAGEHAISCAELAGSIMTKAPHLHFIYRYFGTYLLQSSFIFLILAQKLGNAADALIIDSCSTNLRVLNIFVDVINIDYQRTFARVLQVVLLKRYDGSQEEGSGGNDLDSALLKYRWIAGYNGLWNEDMGVAREANRRPGVR